MNTYLIMTFSSSVYGNCREATVKEDIVVDFVISSYATTKKANESIWHIYIINYCECDYAKILYIYIVYGSKERTDLAVNRFICLVV